MQPTRRRGDNHLDIRIEYEREARLFVATPKTAIGQEFIDFEWATNLTQFWGKSVVLRKWEVEGFCEFAASRGLALTR